MVNHRWLALAVFVWVSGCAQPQTAPSDDAGDGGPALTSTQGATSTLDPAWAAQLDAAFSHENCPAPRPHEGQRYAGPLWDMHVHIPLLTAPEPNGDYGDPTQRQPYIGVDVTVDQIACAFQYDQTAAALAFFSVFPTEAPYQLEFARRVMERYPDVFHPSISPPDENRATVSVDVLRGMLDVHPGLFEAYGELGLYGNPGDPDGMAPDDPRLLDTYPLVAERGLAAYFHLGEGHQAAYERVLSAHPEITFLFHGDQLVVYEDGRQNLTALDDILTRHPNVRYGIDELYGDDYILRRSNTKEQFLAHFEDYEPLLEEDLETWGAFIQRHQDQVIWGTDRGGDAHWSFDLEVGWTLNDYARAFIGRLPADVQEKYAYRNAQALFED